MELEATRPAFERYGKEVIKQARANLTRNDRNVTRELYRSLQFDLTVSPNSIEQRFTSARWGAFQDLGVKGTQSSERAPKSPFQFKSQMIPWEPIISWVTARKIQFRTPGGKFMSYRSTAFLIARSIPRKGLMATEFFSRPARRRGEVLRKELFETLNIDFGNFVAKLQEKR